MKNYQSNLLIQLLLRQSSLFEQFVSFRNDLQNWNCQALQRALGNFNFADHSEWRTLLAVQSLNTAIHKDVLNQQWNELFGFSYILNEFEKPFLFEFAFWLISVENSINDLNLNFFIFLLGFHTKPTRKFDKFYLAICLSKLDSSVR